MRGFCSRAQADKWYKTHHKANTNELLRPLSRYYWHLPNEFVDLLESFSFTNRPSRVNYYPNVPLDRYAMNLVHQFDLPEELVDEVKSYILIRGYGTLGVGSKLQVILVPVGEG